MNVAQDPLESLAQAARQVGALGLSLCSSGNLSGRLDQEHLLIKASRGWMANLAADDVAICRLADGVCLNGLRPSVETGLHRGILQQRPEVNVVLHFQSPFATALCCRQPRVSNFDVTPEVPYYIGPVAWVPYILPGSPELAQAVTQAMLKHNLAMLESHGQVTVGKTYEEAIQRAAFFEMVCAIIVRNGPALRILKDEDAQTLRELANGKGFGV